MSAGTALIQVPGQFLDPPRVIYGRQQRSVGDKLFGYNNENEKRPVLQASFPPNRATWNLLNRSFVSKTAITVLPVLDIRRGHTPWMPRDFDDVRYDQLYLHGIIANKEVSIVY